MSYLPTMASFWIGPYLSWIDQLGLTSFMAHGHHTILYTANEVLNVPKGVEVRPASEIWEDKRISGYKKGKSTRLHPATLPSDYFRWHLQKKTNYFYMDTDYFCLRPLDIWSEEFLAKTGIRSRASLFRYRKNSPTIDLMIKFLSTPYPVPPWFSKKHKLELWLNKLKGKPTSISKMPWGTACGHLQNWALLKKPDPIEVMKENFNMSPHKFPEAFLSIADFEFLLPPNAHLITLGWTVIYDWRPELLDAPPKGSWIKAQLDKYQINHKAAPVVETRKKNREYLAEKWGDDYFLL